MMTCTDVQVVDNRLFTGSTDGTLRIWTLKGLRAATARQPSETDAAADAAEDVARQECNAAEQ